MPNILDTVQISGSSYDLKDKNAPSVSAVTQQEYDNLPSSAKTSNTFFVITDAQAGDLSQYWTSAQTNSAITQATSGKVDTSTYSTYTAATDTALASKQTTLTAGTGINITDNVISATGGGGGKAVSAGTNISVTTGETADTINCTLPISVGGPFNSCLDLTRNAGNSLQGSGNVAVGSYVNVTNNGELGIGRYNVSNTTTTAPIYNNPNKTVFSVGNGTGNKARHNAFEIRQNGDIYLSLNGQDVKLQDQLGGGGGGGSSYSAGDGIDITNDVISVSGVVMSSAITTSITSSSTDAQVPTAKAVYDAIQEGGGGMTEDDELLLSTALVDLNDRKIDASEVKSQLGNYQKKGDYVTTNTLNTRLAEYETALDEQNVEEVTAYALNDLNERFGGLKIVKITESEYAALTTKDENTLYIVVADPT